MVGGAGNTAAQEVGGHVKHISALVLKALLTGVIIYLVLPRFGVTSPTLIWTTIATIVGAAYIIGDLIVLPSTNNAIAAVADAVLAAAIIWFVNNSGGHLLLSMTGLIIAAVAIGVGEYVFHLYLIRTETVRLRLRTEADSNSQRPD